MEIVEFELQHRVHPSSVRSKGPGRTVATHTHTHNVFCTCVLLYFFTFVLLYFCTFVLFHFFTFVLFHFSKGFPESSLDVCWSLSADVLGCHVDVYDQGKKNYNGKSRMVN
jgi:hypothetical protein